MTARVSEAKLVDVAKAADCSPATVSRVLNKHPSVGEQTRQRVVQAVADLGYVATGAFRAGQTRLVGAIIPTIGHAIYATMIDGLQERLAEKDTGLIISTSMYDFDLELEQTRLLLERGATAIILVGAAHHPGTIELLEQRRIPYVFTYTSEPVGLAVGFDNEKAGRMGARFLLDLGHQRIAMIAGITQGNDRAFGRVAGFVRELSNAGIARKSIRIIEAPYQFEAGSTAMKQLLDSGEAPSAVFCGSDILAVGALRYCIGQGLDVPGSISILGFDDLEVADITTPGLTTLRVPAKEMGRLAGDHILANAAQRRHQQRHELTVSLVVRGSTGPVPR